MSWISLFEFLDDLTQDNASNNIRDSWHFSKPLRELLLSSSTWLLLLTFVRQKPKSRLLPKLVTHNPVSDVTPNIKPKWTNALQFPNSKPVENNYLNNREERPLCVHEVGRNSFLEYPRSKRNRHDELARTLKLGKRAIHRLKETSFKQEKSHSWTLNTLAWISCLHWIKHNLESDRNT